MVQDVVQAVDKYQLATKFHHFEGICSSVSSNTGLYSESVKSSSQAISSKSILIYPLIFPYDSKTASYASTPKISHHMEAQTVFTMLEKLSKLTQLII
jgi:hypothetical protein